MSPQCQHRNDFPWHLIPLHMPFLNKEQKHFNLSKPVGQYHTFFGCGLHTRTQLRPFSMQVLMQGNNSKGIHTKRNRCIHIASKEQFHWLNEKIEERFCFLTICNELMVLFCRNTDCLVVHLSQITSILTWVFHSVCHLLFLKGVA